MNNLFDLKQVSIRKEEIKDYVICEAMIRRAFWDLYKPGADEHYLTKQLRLHDDYIPELTRLAVYKNKIVGAIYYAKSKIVSAQKIHEVITFGPLAVDPDFQKQGIGALLIRETLKEAKRLGYSAIIIYGEPNYYPRLGFRRCQEFTITTPEGTYLDALMAYELQPGYLKDKNGAFVVSEVYTNIKKEDVEAYDLLFR